ncbi:thioredoxin family protein [Halobacillus salinus]|uniref:thioredoxin family protein n=1 Tax=Halobacillus salinus TaxID=192814 RepID=UPI0009A6594F|nr:thioredoxin family protein [Halobacillus salinus]
MKRNMIIFATILAALVVVLIVVVNYQNNEKTEGNPYGKSNLDQATIDQLDDPNYQNLIMPEELEEKMEAEEEVTVYFYSPTCIHCQRTTPIVVPMVDKLGVDLKKMNLLEFREQGAKYNIQSTPTIVHYENGEEVARIVGEQPVTAFDNFFHEKVLEDSNQEEE